MSLIYVAFHGNQETGICEIAIYGQKPGYSAGRCWCVKPKCGPEVYGRQASFSVCIPANELFSSGKDASLVEREIDRFVMEFPEPRREFCWVHTDLNLMETTFPWLPWIFNNPNRINSKNWVERVASIPYKAGKRHDCGLHELELKGNQSTARRKAGPVCALHQVHEMAMLQYMEDL